MDQLNGKLQKDQQHCRAVALTLPEHIDGREGKCARLAASSRLYGLVQCYNLGNTISQDEVGFAAVNCANNLEECLEFVKDKYYESVQVNLSFNCRNL